MTTTVAPAELPLRRLLPQADFNSDAQARTALERKHRFIINLGGKGSGKTFTHRVWAMDRASWDTGQIHGVFTNTDKQLKGPVFTELYTAFPVEKEARNGRRPPKQWVRDWVRFDIPIPPGITDYRNIWYTRSGLHVMCGTLHNQSYKQYESFEFSTLRIEEIPAISPEALNAILSRLRCGKGRNCERDHGHRHQAWLFGNPPVGPHKWLADWLDTKEEGAKKLYHSLEEREICDGCEFATPEGAQIARVHGPILNHRQWPLLRRGVGEWLFIKSKTSENRYNLRRGYEDDLAMNSDRATAMAWLEGEYVREVGSGCYDSFSDQNVRDVKYDPTRTLLIGCDINIEPRIAILAHPLLDGEYPSDWKMPGVEQLGVFGEYFSLGGVSDERFAEAMVSGNRGSGDAGYPDDKLRGLPENWAGLANHKGPIIFYGDGAGNIASVHSRNCESSWLIIIQTLNKLGMAGKYSVSVPKGQNPPARDRIHSVNAKLCSVRLNAVGQIETGKPSLSIAARCRHALKDCEQVVWNEEGLAEREWRQGPERFRTHCMAGLGYTIVQRSPGGRDIEASAKNPLDLLPKVPPPFQSPQMR